MPQIHTAHTATHADPQRFSSLFDCGDAVQHRNDDPIALLLHELRGPLAAIQNAISMLRLRGEDAGLRLRMHELIERQARQIARLIASPCQMSGSTLQTMPLQRERLDLRSVLTLAIETATPELTQRRNSLFMSLPDSAIWVFGDASRLEQVFVNLLSNASKYSHPGGRINASMHVEDGHAGVRIRDCGVGISSAAMPFIFDLFVRGNSTAVRKRAGLGIGLALVRSIVESHEGTVSATSAGIGHGSEFTVRLKIAH